MIFLVLRFSFRPETSEEERAAVLARMRRTASVGSVSCSTVGPDLSDGPEGYTHVYCAGVADLGALRSYLYDPVHLEGDREILPRLARLAAFQLSDDPSPGLGEEIAAMHREKLAAYPEWGRLLDAVPR
ncbi:Dabb family protein [Streptomyces hoynatensis]|uniref:Dabb family protein n=1 Tax=Streptomyces hoynatensis TaxID=1141874 RepID=A0A3A9YSR0_9ACTN|nr:Dabb family protein [Streptomyces hoynatensis]RKN38524.1 Dabb family protein [Streptomyces hoynatensis]